ncbi:DoxX family protein [Gordonia sinesedis]
MILRRIARPMLASIFIVSGIDSLRNPEGRAKMAAPFIGDSVRTLPDAVTDNVPTEPVTLVRINGAVHVGAGVMLATGKMPRVAASVLAASLVPTTIAGHPFWEDTDPEARAANRTQFLKNLGLLGGLLITAADTEGKPSLAWRGKRKASAASHAVSAALPFGAAAGTTAWDSLRDRTHEGAVVLGEKSGEAAEKVRDRAPELAEVARERSTEVADRIRERAPEVADKIRERAPELADAARERSTEVADKIRDRAPELADIAVERSTEVADSARSLLHRAGDRVAAAGDRVAATGDRVAATADEGKSRWRRARS